MSEVCHAVNDIYVYVSVTTLISLHLRIEPQEGSAVDFIYLHGLAKGQPTSQELGAVQTKV